MPHWAEIALNAALIGLVMAACVLCAAIIGTGLWALGDLLRDDFQSEPDED